MANYIPIGQDLYADNQGKYYNFANNAYTNIESPFDTMSNKINTLYDTQRKNQLDLLKQQREKAIGGFNQQKKDLAPGYQNQRNQADVVNTQNVARFRELMAANGINASGENLTTQANMASSRQNALSEIDNNEQYAIREIDKQIAGENDPAREQGIHNAIETERASRLAEVWQQAQQQQYQQQMDWRNYQMELQRFELEKQMQEFQMQQARLKASASAKKAAAPKTAKAAAVPPSLDQAYKEYLAQKELEQKYQPRPFDPNQNKARPII